MRKVNINGWEIEVDLGKTLEYYNKLSMDNLLTCCLHCKNYYYGISKTSEVLINFFSNLGIVAEKTAHLSELTGLDNGKHLYDADYLLCGNILVKPIDVERNTEDGALVTNPTELVNGICFHFTNKLPSYVITDLCPQPTLTLKIICEVPWVLNELPV